MDRRSLVFSAAGMPLLPGSQGRLAQISSATGAPQSLRGAGAVLDGLTDDSAAAQRAIDACLETNPARPLIVDGPCRLARSLLIDRAVDQTRGVMRIVGLGSGAGFFPAGNFPIFDSRLRQSAAPSSEYIWFENIRFEAVAGAAGATALADKFLRVQFEGCEFERIRAVAGAIYVQEWHFSRCVAQRWPGTFFSSQGGYHIISTGSIYRNGGGTVFEIVDPTLRNAGCVGCSFHQDIVESNAGSFVKAALVRGLSVSGLYHEGNSGPALDLEHDATNQGVSVTGSMFAPQEARKRDAAFFDIRWGRIEGGRSGGNFCSGRLHLVRGSNNRGLDISGDYAALQLLQAI